MLPEMPNARLATELLAERVAGAGVIGVRHMFGRRALLCDGKVVALIVGDDLLFKPTLAARARLEPVVEVAPFRHRAAYFLVSGFLSADAGWLTALIGASAAELARKARRSPKGRQARSP